MPGSKSSPYAFAMFDDMLIVVGILHIVIGLLYFGLRKLVTEELVEVRKLELQELVKLFQRDAESHVQVRKMTQTKMTSVVSGILTDGACHVLRSRVEAEYIRHKYDTGSTSNTSMIQSIIQPDSPNELGSKIYKMMEMDVGGRRVRLESQEKDTESVEDNSPSETDRSPDGASRNKVIEPSEVRAENDPWKENSLSETFSMM